MNFKKLFFFLLPFCFFACQKEIEVDLPDYGKKLVVEGYIENDEFPIVMLTRSIPYFSHVNIDTFLRSVIIPNADVFVSSSRGEREQLTFQMTDKSPLGFAYVGDSIKGAFDTEYELEIRWNTATYEANTTILQPFDLDSIWFAKSIENNDSIGTIRFQLSDNEAVTNYYQFFVKLRCATFSDPTWVTTMPVAFDDQAFNGQTFNYELLRANPSALFVPTMTDEERREFFRMTFRRGDTVHVRAAAIDYNSYRYWATAANDIMFGQNPFMSPSPVFTNIRGEDVLGVWCGYASRRYELIFD